MTEPHPRSWNSPVVLLATGLGVGALPVAPGTWGALWGIPLTMGLASLESTALRVGVIVCLVLLGVPICGWAARVLGKKDPGSVVWDEFTTVPIVFLLVPSPLWRSPWALAVGFVLHRVFDISKLPPVSYAERLPGGWGIMLDDVVAALYAAVCLWVVCYFGWVQ